MLHNTRAEYAYATYKMPGMVYRPAQRGHNGGAHSDPLSKLRFEEVTNVLRIPSLLLSTVPGAPPGQPSQRN